MAAIGSDNCLEDMVDEQSYSEDRSRLISLLLLLALSPEELPICSFLVTPQNPQPLTPNTRFWGSSSWHWRDRGENLCGDGRPGSQGSTTKVSGNFINSNSLQKPNSGLIGMPPSPTDCLLSTVASKWAAATFNLRTEQNSTSP